MINILYYLKQLHVYSGSVLYINLFAMILTGFLESAGILLLIPMISISGIVDLDAGRIPLLNMFDFLQQIPDSVVLPLILVIFVLLVMSQGMVHRHVSIKNAMIKQGFLRNLRVVTYNNLLRANWSFFIKTRKSDLINLLQKEISRVSTGIGSLLTFMASLISTMVQIVLALVISVELTIFVLFFGAVLLYINRKFLRQSLNLGKRNYELGRSYLAGITEQINGLKDIKSNTLEVSRMHWHELMTKQMKEERVDFIKLKTKTQLYYKMASSVLIAAFIYISLTMFQVNGGQLLLVVVIFSRLWPRIADIQSSLEQIAVTIPSFKAVRDLQNTCRDEAELISKDSGDTPVQLKTSIQCREIQFRYNQSAPNYALKDINLVIPANQMTAFAGRSGAGKSTLIDILMGLNQPEEGNVVIDGIPLSESNLLSWRQSISYVPQDPFLFNTSIKDNLLMVKPEASEEQMWEALYFSSAGEFVNKLPNKLNTIIGDRGIKLSGGERQRLVLARAILRKPSILVLDEATSALDLETEAKIQRALEQLKGKMTIIVIAHRLSTIQNADQVVVLDNGRIIQRGGFNELAERKESAFHELLNNQMRAFN